MGESITLITPASIDAARARRMLLAAYCLDAIDLAPVERRQLAQMLANRLWLPTVAECAAWRPRLVAWSEWYELPQSLAEVLVPAQRLVPTVEES